MDSGNKSSADKTGGYQRFSNNENRSPSKDDVQYDYYDPAEDNRSYETFNNTLPAATSEVEYDYIFEDDAANNQTPFETEVVNDNTFVNYPPNNEGEQGELNPDEGDYYYDYSFPEAPATSKGGDDTGITDDNNTNPRVTDTSNTTPVVDDPNQLTLASQPAGAGLSVNTFINNLQSHDRLVHKGIDGDIWSTSSFRVPTDGIDTTSMPTDNSSVTTDAAMVTGTMEFNDPAEYEYDYYDEDDDVKEVDSLINRRPPATTTLKPEESTSLPSTPTNLNTAYHDDVKEPSAADSSPALENPDSDSSDLDDDSGSVAVSRQIPSASDKPADDPTSENDSESVAVRRQIASASDKPVRDNGPASSTQDDPGSLATRRQIPSAPATKLDGPSVNGKQSLRSKLNKGRPTPVEPPVKDDKVIWPTLKKTTPGTSQKQKKEDPDPEKVKRSFSSKLRFFQRKK